MSTPQSSSQKPGQNPSVTSNTWVDKLLLSFFLMTAITGLAGIYIHIDIWIVSSTFILGALGTISGFLQVKPDLLRNALRLNITDSRLLVTLRVISVCILAVIAFLAFNIYQSLSQQHPLSLTPTAAAFTPAIQPGTAMVGVPTPLTGTISSSPIPVDASTTGVEGANKLLRLFCDAINAGQYTVAYNFMTDTQQSLWKPQQELERWQKCIVPPPNQITMISSTQAYCVLQMLGEDTSVPVRKITLTYSSQDGWKISIYAS
jgi:hypothetical protein